jgi:menaquinone-dependent protoporphyrinogen oxidase
MTVLVTYASKHGSTKEIAERIAATLRRSGIETDLQPVEAVRDVEPYAAVVLGSAIYYGS